MSSSDDEKTPLERAMEKGRVLELECFLKAGIDPNLRDSKENSLLYNAVKNNSVELVGVLIKYKANINLLNTGRESAIHIAARQGNIQMCNLLISNGASLLSENLRNQMPIIAAIKADNQDIVKLFLKISPEILYLKDQGGKYIWDYASSEMMKGLIVKIKKWNSRVPLLYFKRYPSALDKLPEGIFHSLVQFL